MAEVESGLVLCAVIEHLKNVIFFMFSYAVFSPEKLRIPGEKKRLRNKFWIIMVV